MSETIRGLNAVREVLEAEGLNSHLGFIDEAIKDVEALVKALEGIAEFCSADGSTLGAISRLTHVRNTAQDALAAYRSAQK